MDTSPDRRDATPEGVDLLALAEGDAAVADALRQLRTDVIQPVPNDVAATHLRAILTETAATHAADADRGRHWRRRIAGIGGFSALKLAAGAMAAAAATGGGLAATGNLPEPAQRTVSSVAERVGLELPAPSQDATGRPATAGDARSDRGTERGRDDQVRPAEPGKPETPGRSGEAPGQTRRAETPAGEKKTKADEDRPRSQDSEAPGSERGNNGTSGSKDGTQDEGENEGTNEARDTSPDTDRSSGKAEAEKPGPAEPEPKPAKENDQTSDKGAKKP